MKKHILILSAIVALAACTKEVQPVAAPSTITTFTGEALATKITMGDKEGSAYKALWAEGDSLAIVDAASGAQLGVAKLQSGAGANKGTFTTTANIADGTSVKLVYGTPVIPSDQTQTSAAAKNIITNASSEAVSFAKGGDVPFTLVHSPAIVKVSVSSSAFSTLSLKSVAIVAKGKAVTGEDVEYAELTFDSPSALSGTQEAWITTNPIETASDFYVAATMVGTYEGTPNTTVTIPVKFEGKTLAAGKVTAITLSDLTLEKNAVAWYNPVCKRIIPEKGFAYGESNTIVLGNKVGDSAVMDVRANGDFVNVIRYGNEPKSFQIRIADYVNTSTWNTWLIDGKATANGSKHALTGYNSTIAIGKAISNSKVAVAGIFNLLDANENVLWAYTFWGTSEIGSHTYKCGVEVMDRNLGGAESTTASAQQRGLYFQWGRPFPFGYGAALQVVNKDFKVTNWGESAAHANSVATISNKDLTTDWNFPSEDKDSDKHYKNLWGNSETKLESTAGVKTVFDPCPKGWMVVAPSVLKEVFTDGTFVTTPGNGISIKVSETESDFYFCGAFYSGETAGRGSNKGQYFSNAAVASGDRVFLLEIPASAPTEEAPIKISDGAWRANASSIRCMKDADNR